MLLIYFLSFIFLFAFLSIFFIYLFLILGYIATKVPFVSSSRKFVQKILEIMALKENQVLVDLGCGDGLFLIEAEKKYRVKTIGYELSLIAFILSKINIFLKRAKTKIYFKNFFQANLSEADIIFCYLWPSLMPKLSEKFKKELKSGTKIFSLAFPMPNWPNERIEYLDEKNKKWKIYIYQKE